MRKKAGSLDRFTSVVAILDLRLKEVDRCHMELISDDPPFWICNLVGELHKLVISLLRFGFRNLEKDEDGRKDVEEWNLGSWEVEEKNQTASKETAKKKYEKKKKTAMVGRGFRKEWLSEFSWLEYSTEHSFEGETFFFLKWYYDENF